MRCPNCGKRKLKGTVITETSVEIINGTPYQKPDAKSEIVGLRLKCDCGKSWTARNSTVKSI